MLPYETIFATALNAFFLTDCNGRVLAANPFAGKLFGFSPDHMQNLTREVFVDNNDPRLANLLREREECGHARGEITAVLPDGTPFPCDCSSVRLLSGQGVVRYSTELVDIRPFSGGRHLQTIFAHSSEGFVLLDKHLHILAFNEKADILIFQHGRVGTLEIGRSLSDYLPVSRRRPFNQAAEKVMSGETVSYDQAYLLESCGKRWFHFTLSPVWDNSHITGLCISGRDVTEQMTAKQEAERSEEKYRRIFNHSPIPKWVYELNTLRIVEVNDEAIRHYGYSREEFLSMTIRDLRPLGEQQALTETLAAIKSLRTDGQEHHGYWRHLKKNGEVIISDVTGHPVELGDRHARMVISQDVTARIAAEAALLRSNERFRYAARAASDAIWDWDIQAETVLLGEGFKTLFGYAEAGTIVPRNWIIEKLHPEDRDRVTEKIKTTVIMHGGKHWSDEYRFKKADASFALICNTALLLLDEQGLPSRLIGAMRDVTESRAQLEALQAQNRQLREIAWYQSHVVRAPLARLLGLTELALVDNQPDTLTEIIPLLRSTAEELDSIIRGIVGKASEKHKK